MKRLLVLLLALWIFPEALSAKTVLKKEHAKWENFNTAVNDKVVELKDIIFGPIMRIVGFLALSLGVIFLCMGKTQYMMTAIGIGFLMSLGPILADAVFGALLPGL